MGQGHCGSSHREFDWTSRDDLLSVGVSVSGRSDRRIAWQVL